MALAKPLAAPPHLSRRGAGGLLLPNSAAASPTPTITTARTQPRFSAQPKPRSPPPPPPLIPRPKLPIPTNSSDAPTTNGKQDNGNEPSKDTASSSRSSSGAGTGDVLRLMDALRVAPDEDVYISLLRDSVDAAEVADVHAHIKRAALALSLPLANRLLLAYASCGDTVAARKVFDEMPVKNGITWATMVSAYSDGCFHDEAMRLFARMCHQERELAGEDLHGHAIVAVLRSCARSSKLSLGEQVHALVVKTEGLCGDTGSSLLQLYCESNRHDSARRVLQTMRFSSQEPVPEAAWTSFMKACHRDGLPDEAIHVFRDMVSSGAVRSSFSLSSILAVCAESEKHRCYGQQVHADAIKNGVETNQFVASGLVHLYAKKGWLADAARAFQEVGGMPDAACWNAMAMGYARGGWYREAATMMYQMKAAGIDPPGLNVLRMACSR